MIKYQEVKNKRTFSKINLGLDWKLEDSMNNNMLTPGDNIACTNLVDNIVYKSRQQSCNKIW